MSFKELQIEKAKRIEKILADYLPPVCGEQGVIMEAMEYSVMAGGKRLRPMLISETCRLFSGDDTVAHPFMAALEMIHTYSLVHDDLPAMDNDAYRRGRKTTHVVYGEDMGILAGDALLNFAFEIMAKSVADELENGSVELAKAKAGAMKLIARKAGIYGMIGGQVIDVRNVGTVMSIEQVDTINKLKTAALIEAAMMSGALLGGADDATVTKLEKAAACIGKAFQIQDDILDITSSQDELGKPIGSDDKNDKNTYVRLVGLEESKKLVSDLSNEGISLLKECRDGENDGFLEELLLSLIHRKK